MEDDESDQELIPDSQELTKRPRAQVGTEPTKKKMKITCARCFQSIF